MEIQLSRNIPVKKFKAILDVGVKQPRTDIITLLKLTSEHGGLITEENICNEFIFRNNRTMAQRIIKRCQDLELLDQNRRLTSDGHAAVSDEKIYNPQTGVYYIWVSDDPLLPQKLLDIEIIDEQINFRNEIRGNNSSSGESNGNDPSTNIIDIPPWVQSITHEPNIALWDTEQREVRIESIEQKVESMVETRRLRANIILDVSSCRIELEGLYDNTRTFQLFPNFRSVWTQLLGEKINRWDWDTSTLAAPINEINDREKISFRTQLKIEEPEIESFGRFDSITIPNIKIEPINIDEANQWAEFILQENISEYLFQEPYEDLKNDIQSKFPKFQISFPTRTELQTTLEGNQMNDEFTDKFWFINAPLDLVPITNTNEEEK